MQKEKKEGMLYDSPLAGFYNDLMENAEAQYDKELERKEKRLNIIHKKWSIALSIITALISIIALLKSFGVI